MLATKDPIYHLLSPAEYTKVKFVPEQARKTQRGSRGIDVLFF
jgi:hypothetical protein